MQCREAICDVLGQESSTGHSGRNRHSSSSAPQSKKRKVEHITKPTTSSAEDDYEVYESIRHLFYSDDGFTLPSASSASMAAGSVSGSGGADRCALRTSCSLEMHQDTDEKTTPTGLVGQTLLVT